MEPVLYIIAVKRQPEFMSAVTLSRIALHGNGHHLDGSSNSNITSIEFAKPFGEPHYSFAYGNGESLCSEVVPPISEFAAREVQVWCTSPATLAGVTTDWRHLSTIRLESQEKE